MLPTIPTERLILDAFQPSDAEATERLVSDYEVSRFTLNIPHPYPPGGILKWMARHAGEFARGEGAAFAIRQPDRTVVGCVGVRVERRHDRADLGYWIGCPFWGRGYATEAARACVGFAFEHFALNKIAAVHDPANPASGRILRKLGFVHEGTKREQLKKDGVYLDCVEYGLLRRNFVASVTAVNFSSRST